MSTKSSTTTSRTTTSGARRESTRASSGAATPTTTPEPETATAAPAGATAAAEGQAAAPALRKKELIERIVQTSGMKRRDVKPVVEATLSVMGQALTSGESLNIQPLGRIVVNRRKELANGEVLVTRIRRTSPAEKGDDDTAAAAATSATASTD